MKSRFKNFGEKEMLNELFECLHQELSLQVWLKDAGGRYVYANEMMKIADGIQDVDVIGKRDSEIYSETQAKMFEEFDREIFEAGIPLESQYFRNEGTYEAIKKIPLYDEAGEFIGTFGYARDVTAEKLLEEYSKNRAYEEGRFKKIVETAPVGIAIVETATKRIVLVNKKCCKIMRYAEEELCGASWEKFIPNDENPDISERLRSGKISEYGAEQRLVRGDGNVIWTKLTFSTFETDGDGNHYTLLMIEDITHIKLMEDEIKRMGYIDALTGVYNRNYLMQDLRPLGESGRRPLTLVMGDINGLKLCNDVFGHQHGDDFIMSAARAIQEAIEPYPDSYVARIGGDEFMTVLQGVSEDEVQKIMENIRLKLKRHSTEFMDYSIALGAATTYDEYVDTENLGNLAEERMYANKMAVSKHIGDSIIEKLLKMQSTDPLESSHMANVSRYAHNIGRLLGLTSYDVHDLTRAAELHDIGLVACESMRLERGQPIVKFTGDSKPLRKHCDIGYRLLRFSGHYNDLAKYVLSHHEKLDGSGYPAGISSEEIPLFSKIIRIADAYDYYVNPLFEIGLSKEEALAGMKAKVGIDFDEDLFEIFADYILNEKEE